MQFQDLIAPLFTLLGLAITGYISLRLGRMQTAQQSSSSKQTMEMTTEVEFRQDLLDLIEKQNERSQRQDAKIEKLEQNIETQKTLSDEFRRANLTLAIENKRLRDRIEELETDAARLRAEIEKIKRGTDGL